MQGQQSEEVEAVTSRFREAVQVTPAPDELDALPLVVSMVTLPNELLQYIFQHVCNVLDPRIAVPLSSVCNALRTATWALLKQLKEDHEAATALCLKLHYGPWEDALRSCKDLREAKTIYGIKRCPPIPGLLTPADMGLLGTLGSVLPALEELCLQAFGEPEVDDGVQQLVAGLGAGALPALRRLQLAFMHVGDAGAMALAAALEEGALPRLRKLWLTSAAIGDAGLVALAPALRRRPALEKLCLSCNPFGDDGLAALVAPPPPAADAPPTTTGVLTKLKSLSLTGTQITDAGCATLAAALDSGALPALEDAAPFEEAPEEDVSSDDGDHSADDLPASDEAVAALLEAMARRRRIAQTQLGLP